MKDFRSLCSRLSGGILVIFLAAACSLSVPSAYTPEDASTDDGQDGDGPGPCPEGQTRCGDSCVDTTADPMHCGGCFNACTAGMSCVDSVCVCPGGLRDCGGVCVDVASNPAHCGECYNACPEGLVCSSGVCSTECGEGLTNCSGACVNLSSDPMNCGECGNICPTAVGAVAVCEETVCGLDCWPNRWDLDGIPGCEYECVYTSGEICDGADNDCNGLPDDTFPCVRGAEVSCATSCASEGTGVCTPDCRIPSGPACHPPEEECNGLDDDCDGAVDNGFECVPGLGSTCTTACGTAGMQECDSATCTWNPCCAATETCGNGCDDDCNGEADDGCTEVPNDTCASPMDVTSGGRFTGNTTPAVNNSTGSCASTSAGRDVYFSFTLTEMSDVWVSSFGSQFDTVLYVGSTCGGDNIGCWNDYSTSVRQSYVRTEDMAPGTYYVCLDGNGDSRHGDYVLDVYITPSANRSDRCGNPEDFSVTGESGTTCGWNEDADASCDNPFPMTVPDRVYFVVIGPTTSRNVVFSTCNASTNYDSLMHLRRVCTDPASEVVCNDDGADSCPSSRTRSVLQADLAPGIYYLFIKAYGNEFGECGNFLITATGL
jgi:hypothetical protein